METYIHALTWLLKQRRAFELAQAWMGVFLQVHGDLIFNVEELSAAVGDWKVIMEEERRRVSRLGGYAGGVVGWCRAGKV